MGGLDGGYGIYVDKGHPVFVVNYLGQKYTRVRSSSVLPKGDATIVADFVYDGGGMGKGGTITLTVNGKQVGSSRVEATHPLVLGLGGALDVGMDTGAPVDEAYQPPNRSTGKISKVVIDLK